MKKLIFSAIPLVLILACTARAADLAVSETVIDYGTVKEGPPVIKTVTLTNTGSKPITIAKAAAS
jgi:copper(I)-binding protein